MRRNGISGPLVAAALATALPAAAAEAPPTLLEILEVRVVNLEVHVTDRQGRPIEGLTARDFTVKEDGRQVELSHFSEVRGAHGAPSPAPGEPASATGAGGHVVIFLDNFAIRPQGRALVLEGLRGALSGQDAPAGIQYAVASYDGYLRIHQPFTADEGAVLAAVEESGRLESLGVLRQAEREAVLREGFETLRTVQRLLVDENRLDQANRLLRSYAAQVAAEAERQRQLTQANVWALSQLVSALAALPGPKAVVYVSEGLPMRPAAELYAALDEQYARMRPALDDAPSGGDTSLDLRSDALGALDPRAGGAGVSYEDVASSGIGELAGLANAGRVSFYTLKPADIEGSLPPEIAGDLRQVFTPRVQGARERNLAEGLRALAEETGGAAIVGTDVDGLLARARDDLASHYFLGFEPPHPADGQLHKLKVKARGRGLRVRHRTAYLDKPPAAKLSDRTSAALVLGLDDNPLGLRLELAAAEPGPEPGQWSARVELTVPLGFLAGIAAEGARVPAHLLLASRDQEGRLAPVQGLGLELPVESGARLVPLRLLLRPGPQRLAIGLVVPAAGVTSFVSRDVEVGPAAAAAEDGTGSG